MKHFQVSEYGLSAPIPEPLRLALVADLHNMDAAAVAQAVKDAKVDATLILGDLYESPPRRSYYAFDQAIQLLESLSPLPIFYVMGNHDYRLPDEMRGALDRCGVTLLHDTVVPFRGLTLGGIASAEFVRGHVPNTEFLARFASCPGYKVLLCHHPEYYPRFIRDLDIDLTLSGHAHGGQWRFFGRGIYSPGQGLFPRYTGGVYENRLLVSRGLKISRPIPRLFNPRELAILTLTPNTAKSAE